MTSEDYAQERFSTDERIVQALESIAESWVSAPMYLKSKRTGRIRRFASSAECPVSARAADWLLGSKHINWLCRHCM